MWIDAGPTEDSLKSAEFFRYRLITNMFKHNLKKIFLKLHT